MNPKKLVTTYQSNQKDYSYASENCSILDQHCFIPLANKVVNKLPIWLPANAITIISTGCVLLALIIALTAEHTPFPLWIFIPILYFLYLLGDTLDGLQARRTKTGSRLGEFLDHFLDTFVTGEMMLGCLIAYKLDNLMFMGIILYVAYIVQMGSFWEKYKRNAMFFGPISSSEAVFLLVSFMTIGFIPEVNAFMVHPHTITLPLIGALTITLAEIVLIIFAISGLTAFVAGLIRTGGISLNFALYLTLCLALTIMLAQFPDINFFVAFAIQMFFHIAYSSGILSAITMKTRDPFPDILLPTAVALVLAFQLGQPIVYYGFLVYIVVVAMVRTARFIYKNRQYWYWINPPLPSEEDTP